MIHIPLAAETVAHIGPFPITNAMVNTWLVIGIFFAIGLVIRFRARLVPRGLQNFLELVLEGLLKFFDQVTGDRVASRRFLPIAGSLFLFILLSNWMGLLPGIGSIGIWQAHEGEREFVPLFRSAMSDLNLTLAMALFSVIAAHVAGILTVGFFRHGNKFVQLGGVWKALKTLNPMKILTALVEFIVGFIEIFSEFAKVASLSLRLFGNVFAGEVLMTVISSLVAFFVPLPFMALEIIVGIVQATVFSMLTLTYLTLMTQTPHGERVKER